MGAYVNPPDGKKGKWLDENADRLVKPPAKYDEVPGSLPVCLVDNGPFTAAAICFDQGELDEFNSPGDRRPREWFMAKVEDLMPVSDLKQYL